MAGIPESSGKLVLSKFVYYAAGNITNHSMLLMDTDSELVKRYRVTVGFGSVTFSINEVKLAQK